MPPAPPRTGRTSLADAGLYLFDALFDVRLPLFALRREEFAALNLPYAHDLDAGAVESTVRQLADQGLLRLRGATRRPDLGPRVELTPSGGGLWELEREPDWSRFCQASSQPEGPYHAWVLRVRAPAASVAEAYLHTAAACRLHLPVMHHLSRRQVAGSVVPWKPRRSLFELRAPLRSPPQGSHIVVDWTWYEERRTWWQTIPELATLRRDPRGSE